MSLMPDQVQTMKAQLLALKNAARSGALNVKHGDKSVTYRSMSEIKDAIADLEDEIADAEGRRRKRITYIDARRGY